MMSQKTALIGYTGFVGSNLKDQFKFDDLYHSKNIHEIENQQYDLIVCAGIKAQKWYANQHPEEDFQDILTLINHLKKVKAKHFVLISTIDVYPNPIQVNESLVINVENHHAYGKNRKLAEDMIRDLFPNCHILRLPALFGKGLKKNFLYDLMNRVPSTLTQSLFEKLKAEFTNTEFENVDQSYKIDNGVYHLIKPYSENLLEILSLHHRTSLMFTDQDDRFQYYPLSRLWKDIEVVIENEISLLNLATEPLSAKEIYQSLYGQNFENQLDRPKQNYDMHTLYANYFSLDGNYLMDKMAVLKMIKIFISQESL